MVTPLQKVTKHHYHHSPINLPSSGETVIISSPYVVPEDNDENFIISPDEDLRRSILEVEELICLEDDF